MNPIQQAAREGKTLKISYLKKSNNVQVIRHVGPMSVNGRYLFVQDTQEGGQVKKLIRSRILDAKVEDTDFTPTGGFEQEI